MARKKSFDYFEAFVNLAEYSSRAAKMLDESLRNFDVETLPQKLEELHKIEHGADEEKHEVITMLAKEFITPIEREDIAELTQQLDEVTDAVEDILIKIRIYNIKSIRPEALEFSSIILKCCDALTATMKQLCNFKKSALLKEHIIEVNRLESEGDTLFNEAMYRLHSTSTDPIEVMTWSRVFDRMEMCCDEFEDVADIAEYIILKNS